ncbi:hypothetical protein [Sphingobium algorifonticola]|uniref:Uncharacterized protein n=1 Tax=Sphingobium algorifonticola TaxID=2008318 RepID=A0A437JE40_9SPHN|nr:hypothetical protein [Sphingobium algorifonticola]RVT43940.1 hypothetical protein ENE74_05005 [Sphingobium algorifonticola]
MKTKIILLAAMLGLVSPAVAQWELNPLANPYTPPPGAFMPPAKREITESHLRRFAQCVVRGQPALANALLAAEADSPQETAMFRKIAASRNRCLGKGRLAMKNRAMRGALAEQMYLQAYPDPVRAPARPDAPVRTSPDSTKAYHDYGNCVVTRDPAAADAVLRAKPGSVEEKQTYQQTAAALSSCLSGDDAALRIDRLTMRGYLAEALYRHRRG